MTSFMLCENSSCVRIDTQAEERTKDDEPEDAPNASSAPENQ
jgi:hypothetical protein